MAALLEDLQSAGSEICQNLWPREDTPSDISTMTAKLRTAIAAIDEWKESAARAGARAAFAHAKS